MTLTPTLKEELANLCHQQWSGWMEYLFSKCSYTQSGKLDGKGKAVIPILSVKRWLRQMRTNYINLPENEKESDRIEADKFIQLFNKYSQTKSQMVEQILGIIGENEEEDWSRHKDEHLPAGVMSDIREENIEKSIRNQLRLQIKEEINKL